LNLEQLKQYVCRVLQLLHVFIIMQYWKYRIYADGSDLWSLTRVLMKKRILLSVGTAKCIRGTKEISSWVPVKKSG